MTDMFKGDDAGLIELKPCPFCGEAARITRNRDRHKNDGEWDVECDGCGAAIRKEHSQASAAMFWNALAEGRRSPGGGGEISMLEATLCPTCRGVGLVDPDGLPERVNDQCADAGPCPHSHDMLAWLAERPSLELDYGFDSEEEDMFWRVHERSGNINDREWDLIGQGATPLAALLSAKSYMESTNAEQPE